MEPNNNMMPPQMPPQMPSQPQPQPQMQDKGGNSMGMIIGAIVVLIVIILGAFYFMRDTSNNEVLDGQMDAIGTQSTADDTGSIEMDLEMTDIDNLDYDLDEENYTSS